MKEKYNEKYRRIGLKISYYRKMKGMTQEQLAEKIDKKPCFHRRCGSPERKQDGIP